MSADEFLALKVLASKDAILLQHRAGVGQLFNFPEALNSAGPVSFGEALVRRTATFITNCILVAIAGAIGWSLGDLIPERTPQVPPPR